MCVCLFIYFIHISIFPLSHGLFKLVKLSAYYFVEKMRIQNAENLEKENLETKHEIRTKREVNKNKIKL